MRREQDRLLFNWQALNQNVNAGKDHLVGDGLHGIDVSVLDSACEVVLTLRKDDRTLRSETLRTVC